MKFRTLAVGAAALALAVSLTSLGAKANTLTLQNVTFSTADLGGGQLQLTIDNALNANGNWTGINYLESFALNNIGTFATASLTGFNYQSGGLSNGSATGCNGNGAGFACFLASPGPLQLSNHMVFDISFSGGTTNFDLPSLKIDFWANSFQTKSTGDLLSQSIGQTPLPAALPLFATGLGAMGLFGWWRKRKAAAVA
jgi:hypothetical protein